MNEAHLKLCSSVEWGDFVERDLLPWVLEGVDLGNEALEIGPGPGKTTDLLVTRVPQLTVVEADEQLAQDLAERMAGTPVTVIHADATRLPFESWRFDSVLALTMLHHVPSPKLQDRLFGEACRALRPGGAFIGVDSLDGAAFQELHRDDICVPIDPDTLSGRLARAGFVDVMVETNDYATRFYACAPDVDSPIPQHRAAP
ncbi:MAG: class I SAM-dependent methyltransferase [Acidimicrobiales bacterium]|nr:class I SAM-dependent methyltransferase [Acidimicrobiales bacterium]